MKTALLVGAIISLCVTSSLASIALNSSRSNIYRIQIRGTAVTASTNISGAVAQTVYRTPAAGDFLLTQVCAGLVDGGTLVQVGGVGIAQVGSGLCQTFTPGMILPPDSVVTCTTFAADANSFCTITGILGPPPPPTPTPQP